MSPFARPWSGGIELFVRLTPKASEDRVRGQRGGDDGRIWLEVGVRALPENGAANAALEKLVAKALGVPLTSVSVASGGRSRLKTLRIAGDVSVLAGAAARLGDD